jgi:hypothetical protein
VPVEGAPVQRFVTVDWDMRVSPTNSSAGFGPFFGVEAYDAANADNGIRLLGALGVDANTGDVLYQLQDSGELAEAGTVVEFDQWHHYQLVLDFATDSYQGFLNGALVATTGFVDRGFNVNDFTDADITAIGASSDVVSQGLSSSAVFDNFVVREGLGQELLGDYDMDGDVDGADYTRWRATFGQMVAATGDGADGNGNGIVDAADYVVWRNMLATGAGSVSVVVPEPASVLLGLIGLLAFVSGKAAQLFLRLSRK